MSKIPTPLEPDLSLVKAETACEALGTMTLDDAAKPLLDDTVAPNAFVVRLFDAGLWVDGMRFLAAAMPKVNAVRWGSSCVRTAAPPATDADEAALAAAESWCETPDEELRVLAAEAADATGYETPAGWIAAAAGWSAGSLAPPELDPVPPGPTLTAQALVAALLLAAAAGDPAEVEALQEDFARRGVEFASGAEGS